MREKQINENQIELKVIEDVYRASIDEDGNEIIRLVKKNVKTRQIVYKHDISYIKELLSTKNIPLKTKCTICMNGQEVTVDGNYDKLKQSIFNPKERDSIGFKFY